MATTKTAVTKASGKSTAVVSLKDKLKGYAKQAVEVANETGPGGSFVSFKAGQITVAGAAVAGNKLDVIVVASTLENAYYGGDYDSDNPQPPLCYAFGDKLDDMAPHEKSAEPQHSSCKGCPHNEFGSAEKGKGKACKNVVRLALLPGKPLTEEAVERGDVAYAKLPVTSVKAYSQYVKRLDAAFELPPFAFVTQIATQVDSKTQFKVTFEDAAMIDDDDILALIIKRHEAETETIGFPYPEPREAPPPPARGGKKAVAAKTRKY
jgi:hypothetical protein